MVTVIGGPVNLVILTRRPIPN